MLTVTVSNRPKMTITLNHLKGEMIFGTTEPFTKSGNNSERKKTFGNFLIYQATKFNPTVLWDLTTLISHFNNSLYPGESWTQLFSRESTLI